MLENEKNILCGNNQCHTYCNSSVLPMHIICLYVARHYSFSDATNRIRDVACQLVCVNNFFLNEFYLCL